MNALSPYTGWTRDEWAALADRLLAATRPYASPGLARVVLPGPVGGYGRDVDGLEGFARTFLLAGFRLAGEGGADPYGLAERYAQGLANGTDPSADERWVRLDEHPQARVEAASIALVLDLTRPWIWDRLDAAVRDRVVGYLAPAAQGVSYPRCNWVWFRLVVQTFLRSVGGPFDLGEMAEDLATHDSFVRADGWLADGDERSYDHYAGWALQLYPVLWARMSGAAGLAEARRSADVARLDRYLQDAVRLVGADGAPMAQGRSLVYRFAAAAPFWVGAMAEVPSLSPGLLRRAASGVVRHFTERGVPDADGLLNLGWFGEWPALRQRYSGPGSPYWAAKGLLGLALPANHPAWTAVEEPLPVETSDQLFVVRAPGWVVSATRGDGVVRVSNHGTDHAVQDAVVADSPLYARLGYSTATFPLLDEKSWTDPLDQSVSLVDAVGRATHRTGMRTLELRVDAVDGPPVGIGSSVQQAHWLVPTGDQERHGSGYVGVATGAGTLTTVSLVRGPWEVRLVRVDSLAADQEASRLRLRVGGWPVAGDDVRTDAAGSSAESRSGGVLSRVRSAGDVSGSAGVTLSHDASPLGTVTATPWLTFPVRVGAWMASVVELTRSGTSPPHQLHDVSVTTDPGDGPTGTEQITVRWPDGQQTSHSLTDATAAPAAVPVESMPGSA